MEIIATLKEVSPLVTRTYKDKEGENRNITVKGFTFRRGRDTFYAEAYRDLAAAGALEEPERDYTY